MMLHITVKNHNRSSEESSSELRQVPGSAVSSIVIKQKMFGSARTLPWSWLELSDQAEQSGKECLRCKEANSLSGWASEILCADEKTFQKVNHHCSQ